MATNWNTLLASITNAADILAILKKILPLLDGKVDSTAIDELLAQLNKVAEDGKITIQEVLKTVDFLDQRIDERTNAFNDAIEAAAAAGAGANGWTDLLIKTEDGSTQRDINERSLKNGEYAPLLGSPVKLKLNPIMASFIYGINDPNHKDDDLNNFRGINNPDAYHDSNVAIGAVSFGRNNPPFAYLSLAGGHDCVPFGVASFVLGAGSCTGNPDDPVASANGVYGYCSLAVGKNTQARGRISNAMGERCLSESRYSSTDGYKCIAGKRLPTHPDYVLYGDDGSEGAAARAHGYRAEAYGNFAFSYGTFLLAFNGAQVIGKGINEGSPLEISKRGLGLGYNVDVPTIFCQEGPGVNGAHAWIGFNTAEPLTKYDFRLGKSDTVIHHIEVPGNPDVLTANEVKGLMGDGTYKSLHNIIVTHPNAGQPYGIVQFRLNGVEYLTVDVTRKASFAREIETNYGLIVAGDRVIGGQMPAIADLPPSATLEDIIAKVNTLLAALRADTGHGLLAK
ncbi:hypothetical protein [Acinetobacter nosocomialis]|uniref:hypothetical protein n=1 Tax=Acinetobacter nosocomialis TaxID=106654 RepID=UPI00237E4D89|nr:hypothetical protein [Acinetobacter nosocomialis]MDE1703241.1 hypothetical protein [Acinetobacter nosocomialis]HDG7211750.1 hypothetical protein [Acinetobacter nosocomialis]